MQPLLGRSAAAAAGVAAASSGRASPAPLCSCQHTAVALSWWPPATALLSQPGWKMPGHPDPQGTLALGSGVGYRGSGAGSLVLLTCLGLAQRLLPRSGSGVSTWFGLEALKMGTGRGAGGAGREIPTAGPPWQLAGSPGVTLNMHKREQIAAALLSDTEVRPAETTGPGSLSAG